MTFKKVLLVLVTALLIASVPLAVLPGPTEAEESDAWIDISTNYVFSSGTNYMSNLDLNMNASIYVNAGATLIADKVNVRWGGPTDGQ